MSSSRGSRSRSRPARRSIPWLLWPALGLLGVVLSVSAQAPAPAPSRPVPGPSPAAAPPASNPAGAPAASAMDRPLQLVNEARQAFAGVRDYSCVLLVQERVRGQLQPEHMIDMKVRSQPFSVYMRWLGPRQFAGQEACYVAGRNNNQMRVHSRGILGAVGFVSLDPRDPRVMEHSRHTITEAGIGNIINRLAQAWETERQLNLTQVNIAEYQYNQRRCVRVEAVHPDPSGGRFGSYRTVIYFDKENHLPTRVELYDWPRSGGAPGGELLECYSYLNLRFNVGLGDATFNH